MVGSRLGIALALVCPSCEEQTDVSPEDSEESSGTDASPEDSEESSGTDASEEAGGRGSTGEAVDTTAGSDPEGGGGAGDGPPEDSGTEVCGLAACEALGAECGSITDACGEDIDCGTCEGASECGSDGRPNRCACVAEPLSAGSPIEPPYAADASALPGSLGLAAGSNGSAFVVYGRSEETRVVEIDDGPPLGRGWPGSPSQAIAVARPDGAVDVLFTSGGTTYRLYELAGQWASEPLNAGEDWSDLSATYIDDDLHLVHIQNGALWYRVRDENGWDQDELVARESNRFFTETALASGSRGSTYAVYSTWALASTYPRPCYRAYLYLLRRGPDGGTSTRPLAESPECSDDFDRWRFRDLSIVAHDDDHVSILAISNRRAHVIDDYAQGEPAVEFIEATNAGALALDAAGRLHLVASIDDARIDHGQRVPLSADWKWETVRETPSAAVAVAASIDGGLFAAYVDSMNSRVHLSRGHWCE